MAISNINCGYDSGTQHLRVTWSWRHGNEDSVTLTLTRELDQRVILRRVVDWASFAAAAAQGIGVDMGEVDCPVSLTIKEGQAETSVSVAQAPRYRVCWGLRRPKRSMFGEATAILDVTFPAQLTADLLRVLKPWAIGYGTPDGDIGFLPAMETGKNTFGPFDFSSEADLELNVSPEYRHLIVLERDE